MASLPTISVVIITRDRPRVAAHVLAALRRQTVGPLETLVVDTSREPADGERLAREFPEVRLLSFPNGVNSMPWSRNIAVSAAHGEVVAYLDDDAIPAPDWLEHLRAPYADAAVMAVGGRVVEGMDLPEDAQAGQPVARLEDDGSVTGDFNLVVPRPVDVDHIKGCNMSFRGEALRRVGGFDENYTGACHREETDVCLRLRRAGMRIVYTSDAVVDHKVIRMFGRTDSRLVPARKAFDFGYYELYFSIKHQPKGRALRLGAYSLAQSVYLWGEAVVRTTQAMVLYGAGVWWALLSAGRRTPHLMARGAGAGPPDSRPPSEAEDQSRVLPSASEGQSFVLPPASGPGNLREQTP